MGYFVKNQDHLLVLEDRVPIRTVKQGSLFTLGKAFTFRGQSYDIGVRLDKNASNADTDCYNIPVFEASSEQEVFLEITRRALREQERRFLVWQPNNSLPGLYDVFEGNPLRIEPVKYSLTTLDRVFPNAPPGVFDRIQNHLQRGDSS